MTRLFLMFCGMTFAALAAGCSAYAVPGGPANFKAMKLSSTDRDQQSDPSTVEAINLKPLAQFPATIAVVRIQSASYDDRTVKMYGSGMYSVAITRDVEKPEQFDKIAALPMVRELEPINRLELPENLSSQKDLRDAAAKLHADMLLIYTFDDSFEDRDNASLVTVLTIGLAPTKTLKVTSVASAVLIDVRNGYIYGAADASESKTALADCWGENATADGTREEVESKAFQKLCDNFQKTWGHVVTEYAPMTASRP